MHRSCYNNFSEKRCDNSKFALLKSKQLLGFISHNKCSVLKFVLRSGKKEVKYILSILFVISLEIFGDDVRIAEFLGPGVLKTAISSYIKIILEISSNYKNRSKLPLILQLVIYLNSIKIMRSKTSSQRLNEIVIRSLLGL